MPAKTTSHIASLETRGYSRLTSDVSFRPRAIAHLYSGLRSRAACLPWENRRECPPSTTWTTTRARRDSCRWLAIAGRSDARAGAPSYWPERWPWLAWPARCTGCACRTDNAARPTYLGLSWRGRLSGRSPRSLENQPSHAWSRSAPTEHEFPSIRLGDLRDLSYSHTFPHDDRFGGWTAGSSYHPPAPLRPSPSLVQVTVCPPIASPGSIGTMACLWSATLVRLPRTLRS